MSRYPLLESLRGAREREEAEITAPVRERLVQTQARADSLGRSLDALTRGVAGKIGESMLEGIGYEMSALIWREITKAVAARVSRPGDFVTLNLPIDALRFMDRRSIERAVLDEYLADLPRNISLGVESVPLINRTVTQLRIHVPAQGYNKVLA